MTDGKYSVDDILDEYSGGGDSGGSSDISLDDIIRGLDRDGKISFDHGEEQPNNGEESLRSDSSSETYGREKNVNGQSSAGESRGSVSRGEGDRFSDKYSKLYSAVTSVKENENREPYIPAPKPDRSFSEKFEEPNLYGDSEERDEEKAGISSLFKKRSARSQSARPQQSAGRENQAPPMPPIGSISEDKPKADDPFEKYSSIGTESTLDNILKEYSGVKKKTSVGENTRHKSITDFFTKLVPKTDSTEEGTSGNTELLDGMLKAKRDRVSRTQNVAPIERKSISDIDLGLDGKIMPDTSQIPNAEQRSEIEKLNALKERRSKKIKDFVLVGEEEDVPEEEQGGSEQAVIEDFENLSDAPSIAHDIGGLKGSLILRLFVLIICFAASFYIALANDGANDGQALPIMDLLNKRVSVNTYLFVNALIGLVAAFTSYTVVSGGLSKLFSLKADCDSLCALSIVASTASAIIMYANRNLIRGSGVHIYISVAIGSLLFNTLGKLFIVSRTQRSFRFVSGSGDKYAIFSVSDEETAQSFTRGALSDFPRLAAMRRTELLADFLKTSYSSDSADKFCHVFTYIAVAAAAAIGFIAGFVGKQEYAASSIYIGISVFVGVIAICAGFSVMLVVNLPMFRASVKNSELQGVVIGYDSVEEFAETNSVLIDAEQLFPQGSVRLSAIKVFSDTRIDEAIVEAASLTTHAGSILKNMFYDIIAGKTELLNQVESYIFEDSMGLCGWINNKRVLLGNRELMINHSIEGVPPLTKEKEYTENGRYAVYLSISGELSAMFLVEITPAMEVGQAFAELQKNGVYSMIRTVDSLVSINRLSDLFEISPEYLKLIPFRVHEQFAEVTAYQQRQRAALACSGRFSAFASLILSCRRVKTTIGVGIGLQAVSILLGILICLAMTVVGSFEEMSASMEVLYSFVFAAVLIIFQMFRKN